MHLLKFNTQKTSKKYFFLRLVEKMTLAAALKVEFLRQL